MSTGRVLLNKLGTVLNSKHKLSPKGKSSSISLRTVPTEKQLIQERLLKYKELAAAFSYPKKEELRLEYDRLFRLSEIWLYGAEYTAENEFQRAKELSDISGFYRAFGLQVDKERPDALSCELEFMHYLIYKELYALTKNLSKAQAKAKICQDAQKKFFQAHLYPAAKKIVEKVILASEDGFYSEIAQSLCAFLELEEKFLRTEIYENYFLTRIPTNQKPNSHESST